MSFEKIIERHIARVATFCDSPDEVVLRLFVEEKQERLAVKMVASLERDEVRSVAIIAASVPFVDEGSFVAGVARRVADDVEQSRGALDELGVRLFGIEPLDERAASPAVALADYLERIARRVAPAIGQLVVVVVPSEIGDPDAYLATLGRLAAATASPSVRYVSVETGAAPGAALLEVARQRMPHRLSFTRADDARRAFARETKEHSAAIAVHLRSDASDPWTLASDLTDAARRAWHERGAPPVSELTSLPLLQPESRVAEHLEAMALALGPEGSAFVLVELDGLSHEASCHIARALAESASSRRVRYFVGGPACGERSLLPPAHIVSHSVRFALDDITSGYRATLDDPSLPVPERVRILCMLSGLAASRHDQHTKDNRLRAIELAAEAATVAQGAEPVVLRAAALLTLGNAFLADNQDAPARDAYRASAHVALEERNLPLAGQALGQVGITHARQGAYPLAIQSFDGARETFHRVGHTPGEAQMLIWLGDAERKRGAGEDAVAAWTRALERVAQGTPAAGDPVGDVAAQAHERLAKLFEQLGDPHRARQHARDAADHGGNGTIYEAF